MFGSGRIRIGQREKIGGILVGSKGKLLVVFEQEFQKNGAEERGEDDEHDHGYDGVDGSACEKSSFDPFVADDESDFTAGDHAAADLRGFLPIMTAELCHAAAADNFTHNAREDKADPEQKQRGGKSVKTDADPDVCKEYGRKDHVRIDVYFSVDVVCIFQRAENDACQIGARDVGDPEQFFCGKGVKEADDKA